MFVGDANTNPFEFTGTKEDRTKKPIKIETHEINAIEIK